MVAMVVTMMMWMAVVLAEVTFTRSFEDRISVGEPRTEMDLE